MAQWIQKANRSIKRRGTKESVLELSLVDLPVDQEQKDITQQKHLKKWQEKGKNNDKRQWKL